MDSISKFFISFLLSVLLSQWGFASAEKEKPQRAPVEINIPESLLEGLSQEQKEDVATIKALLEKRIFTWAKFPVELPPTMFSATQGQVVELHELFQGVTNAEVAELGRGNPALTSDQISQIRQEGIFSVPSKRYPGQFHVWKMRLFLQKGQKNIIVTFQNQIASGLGHILVSLPDNLWSQDEDKISVRTGIRNIYNGIIETLGLVIGLNERAPRYDASDLQKILENARIANLKSTQENSSTEFNQSGFDLRLYDDELMEKVFPVLSRIQERVASDWVEQKLKVAGESAGETAATLSDELQNAFYQEVLASNEIETLSSGIGSLLVNHAKALSHLQQRELEFAEKVKKVQEDALSELKANHKIRSLIPNWAESRASQKAQEFYDKNRAFFYASVVDELRQKGLAEEAAHMERDLEFLEGEFKNLKANLASETVSASTLKFERKIWSKDRWVVEKNAATGHFSYRSAETVTVDTGSAFWRLRAAWARTKTWFNNGLYHILVSNLWNGPLGLRSLVGAEPFSYEWSLDSETGQLTPSTYHMRGTLESRLRSLRANRDRIIDQHRRSEDSGFFGKRAERFGLFFTVDLARWLMPSAILSVGQPLLTVLNLGFGLGATATSLAWAPLSSLIGMGWDALVYDTQGPRKSSKIMGRFLPLVNRLLVQSVVFGGGETVLGLLGTVIHPAMALGHFAVGSVRLALREAYDRAIIPLIASLGRIPGSDSSFFVKRIAGPGVSSEVFYQIKNIDTPLLSLLALMEDLELERFQRATSDEISLSRGSFEKLMESFSVLFPAARSYWSNETLNRIDERNREIFNTYRDELSQRKQLYSNLTQVQQRGHIRLNAEDLSRLLEKSAAVTRSFYQKIFANWSPENIALFWVSENLAPGSWEALSQKYLASIFGKEILTSLEDSDRTLRIVVNEPDLEEYARGIVNGLISDTTFVSGIDQGDTANSRRNSALRRIDPRTISIGAGAREMCAGFLLKSEI